MPRTNSRRRQRIQAQRGRKQCLWSGLDGPCGDVGTCLIGSRLEAPKNRCAPTRIGIGGQPLGVLGEGRQGPSADGASRALQGMRCQAPVLVGGRMLERADGDGQLLGEQAENLQLEPWVA